MEKTTFLIQLFASGDLTDITTTGCGTVKPCQGRGTKHSPHHDLLKKKKKVCAAFRVSSSDAGLSVVLGRMAAKKTLQTTSTPIYSGGCKCSWGCPHRILHHLLSHRLLDYQHKYHISRPRRAISTSPPEVGHFRRRHISKALWTLWTSGAAAHLICF